MLSWWAEGPDAFSLNALCETVGLSKPGLYREFGGDDGLMAAALARYQALRVTPLLGALESEVPFPQAVEGLVQWLTEKRELPSGCLLARVRTSSRMHGPETRARIDTMRDQQRDAFGAWVARAQARGEAAPDVAPELAGIYVDTQLTTLLSLVSDGEDPERVRAQARLAFSALLPPRH